jgi:hypothetical protein
MIKEISTIKEFQELCQQFFNKKHNFFWKQRSCKKVGDYDLNSIENLIQNLFFQNLSSDKNKLPRLKIWADKKNSNYTCVGVFMGSICQLTNKTVFQDLIWQTKGKLATTFLEKKTLLDILRTAEAFAKKNNFDSFRVTRDVSHHSIGRQKITNFYTNSGFSPAIITYVKKLN